MKGNGTTNKTFYSNNAKKLVPSSSSRNYFRTKSLITNKKTSLHSRSSQSIGDTNLMILGNSIDKENLANCILKIEKEYKMKHREIRELWASINTLNKETKNSILIIEAILTKSNEKKKQNNNEKENKQESLFITGDIPNRSKHILNLQQLLQNSKSILIEHQQKYDEYENNPKVNRMKELERKTQNQNNIIEQLQLDNAKLQDRIKEIFHTLTTLIKTERNLKASGIQTQFKIKETTTDLSITNDLITFKTKSIEDFEKTCLTNKEVIQQLKIMLKEQETTIENSTKMKKEMLSNLSEKEGYDKKDIGLNKHIALMTMEIEKTKKTIKDLKSHSLFLEAKRSNFKKERPKIEKILKKPPLLSKEKNKLIKEHEKEMLQMKEDKQINENKHKKTITLKIQMLKERSDEINSINKDINVLIKHNEGKKKEMKENRSQLIELEVNDKKKQKEIEPLLKKVKKIEEEMTQKKKKAYKEEKETRKDALNQIEAKLKKQKEIKDQHNQKKDKLNKAINVNKEKITSLQSQKSRLIQEKQLLLQNDIPTTQTQQIIETNNNILNQVNPV